MELCYLQYGKSITCFPQVHIISLHTVVPFVVMTFHPLYYYASPFYNPFTISPPLLLCMP